MNLFLSLMLFSRRKARSHRFVGSLSVSKQWGYAVVTTNKETSFSFPIAVTDVFGGWVTRNASVADNIASIRSLRSSEITLITNQVSSQTSWYFVVIGRL